MLVNNISNADYHADTSRLGSSQIKAVLANPAKYKASLTAINEPTAAMRLGSLVHSLALEPEKTADDFIFSAASSRATKAYKQEAAESGGDKTIMLADEVRKARHMAESLLSETAMQLGTDSVAEQSIFWKDSNGLKLKARPDLWHRDRLIMIDVKTAADASPKAFAGSVARYGYDLSAALYIEGAEEAGYVVDEFLWVVVESVAPFVAQTYIASYEWLERGATLLNRAKSRFIQCRNNDSWPSYLDSNNPHLLFMPEYLMLDAGIF